MKDSKILENTVEEMELEHGYQTSVIDKHAFDITLNPAMLAGTVLGAMGGSRIGSKIEAKNQLRRSLQSTSPTMNLGNNHYEEADNISKNLSVLFTPMSVIYQIKMNNQTVTIDAIDTDAMDDEMEDAWKRRDAQYFKNLMINKAMSEIQLVEQMYAKRLLQKRMEIENSIKKQSTEVEDGPVPELDISPCDLIDEVISLKEACEKSQTLAAVILESVDGDIDYKLPLTLERPIDKYASALSGTLKFFGFNTSKQDMKETQDKYLKSSYLASRLKTAFLPDRVLFIVDGIVVTQLAAIDMNEDGFQNFEKHNDKYFRELFMTRAKKGLQEMNPPIEKKASLSGQIQEIFQSQEVHPLIYNLVLNKKYKDDWLDFDPEVLISEIEDDFGLKGTGINDFAMDKILMIQAVRKSPIVFEEPLYFEKCVRAFCGMPIDFNKWEPNISGEDIIWTLHIMDELTPGKDLFSFLSESAVEYIEMCLVNQEYRTVSVKKPIINSLLEKKFFQTLNEDLLTAWNSAATEKARNDQEVERTIKINKICAEMSAKILDTLRKLPNLDLSSVGYMVQQIGEKAGFNEMLINLTKKNVRLNVGIDLMIDVKDTDLAHQKEIYKV